MIKIKYIATTKGQLITENKTIVGDGFGSVLFKNVGTSVLFINDNIELAPGSVWVWENPPYVEIGENIAIRFIDALDVVHKALIIRTYYKEKL